MLDIPAELRTQVHRRLRDEYFIWMTTVAADLSPQPRPVWFVWDDPQDSFLIYSQPGAHKVRHLALHSRLALHFNADQTADKDILIFIGTGRVDPEAPLAHEQPAFLKKYRDGILSLGMTLEEFSRDYSVAIRVTPSSVRGG